MNPKSEVGGKRARPHPEPRSAGVPPAGAPSVSLGGGTGGEAPPEPAAGDGRATVALVVGRNAGIASEQALREPLADWVQLGDRVTARRPAEDQLASRSPVCPAVVSLRYQLADLLMPRLGFRFGRLSLLLAAGGLGLMGPRAADAQTASFDPNSVLANPAPASPLQTLGQQNTPNEMNVFQPGGAGAANPLPQIFRFGPLQFHPSLDYSFSYGNGLQSGLGNQQSSIIQTVSPGVLLDLGQHWALSYTPSFQFYSSDQFHNTVNQAFALTGGVEYADWKFGLSQTAGYSSSPTVATGTQTDQTSYGTSLSASRALTSKISADFGLNQAIALAPSYDDSYTWSTMDWLSYAFWSRLNAGIGAGGGYVMVQSDSRVRSVGANNQNLDQTYEQLQARVNWRATDKISFQISGGFEDRQFSSAGSSDSLSPIFSGTIQYQPFKDTQISLTAGSSVSSSTLYLAAQQTQLTSVGLNLNQQLFRKFSLGLGATYAETAYSTAVAGGSAAAAAANRTDDIASFNVRLSHPCFKRGTWSIFYQYSDNTSNQRGYTFASNQTGFELGYRF